MVPRGSPHVDKVSGEPVRRSPGHDAVTVRPSCVLRVCAGQEAVRDDDRYPAEASGQRLVAATPATVAKLVGLGYEVLVESGAGAAATFADEAYAEAGAAVVDQAAAWGADVVTAVDAPSDDRLALLRKGAVLVAQLQPAQHPELVQALAARGVTALALDAVPRISRAQSLDVLSSMANVAGYRAVVEAAQEFGGMFAGQVTAAGKTPPARVFVIGAGVAGLAAIGTADSLGAQVRAFDVRPEVGEQIESMGAQFVRAPQAQQEISADGYAKPLTDEQAAPRSTCTRRSAPRRTSSSPPRSCAARHRRRSRPRPSPR